MIYYGDGVPVDVGVVPLSCVSEVVESCPNLCNLIAYGWGFQYDDDCLERFVRAVQSHAVLRTLWLSRHHENAILVSRLEQLVRDPTCTLSSLV